MVNYQISAQISPPHAGVGVGMAATFQNKRHKNEKEAIMNTLGLRLPDVLCEPWGVLFSLCTGVAKRVPLRQVIAEVLDHYITLDSLEHLDPKVKPRWWANLRPVLRRYLEGV